MPTLPDPDMELILSVPVPRFAITIVCAGVRLPIGTALKLSAPGDTESIGVPTPEPVRLTAVGLADVNVRVAERAPSAVGVKVTPTVQFAPGAIVEQPF